MPGEGERGSIVSTKWHFNVVKTRRVSEGARIPRRRGGLKLANERRGPAMVIANNKIYFAGLLNPGAE